MQLAFQSHALGAHYWEEKKRRLMRGRQLVDQDTDAQVHKFNADHRLYREKHKRGIFSKLAPEDEVRSSRACCLSIKRGADGPAGAFKQTARPL